MPETERRALKHGFNEHGRSVERPTLSSRYQNHLPNDIELVLLELIHQSRDALRKAREAYLIKKGQTLEPKEREEI